MTQDVAARIMELIRANSEVEGELTPQSNIIADTSLDSVSVMDLVLELEDEFDITIPLNRIAEIHTVQQLADAVAALQAEGAQ